jgi:hypothetical protein
MGGNTRDPSIPESVITHHLASDQFDTIANGLIMLIAELRIANGTRRDPEPAPADCDHEPWQFTSPKPPHERLLAFVDDANQVRHVPVTRADEVPAGWRRILLA